MERQLSDGELFQLIKDKDESAYFQLFRRYSKSLIELSYFLLRKDLPLAEEVVSDVFFRIWQNPKLSEIDKPKAYLYRAVKNASLNELAKSSRYNHVDIEKAFHISGTETSALDDFIQAEEFKELEDILDLLPERRRLVFKLSRIDGLKHKEIADLLEISTRTVEDHISNALVFLQKVMRQKSSY